LLFYDVESIVILFPEDFVADESPSETKPFLTLFEYDLIGGHWFLQNQAIGRILDRQYLLFPREPPRVSDTQTNMIACW
jgi:hypothetical protein